MPSHTQLIRLMNAASCYVVNVPLTSGSIYSCISDLKYFPGEYLLITALFATNYTGKQDTLKKVTCNFNYA